MSALYYLVSKRSNLPEISPVRDEVFPTNFWPLIFLRFGPAGDLDCYLVAV
jgi:hypothetical protein